MSHHPRTIATPAAETTVVPFVDELRTYPSFHGVDTTLVGIWTDPVLEQVVSVEQQGAPRTPRLHSD